MPLVRAERVMETSTTVGTGSLALGGPVSGFRTFSSVMTVSDTCYYVIQEVTSSGRPSGAWEVGLGTLASSSSLARTTVIASSSSNAKVDFAAGTKYVFLSFTAFEASDIYTKLISNDLTAITDLATDDHMVLTDTSDNGNAKRITVANVLEAIDDRVANLIVAGTGISKTYNDIAGTLTIANTVSNTASDIQVYSASDTWTKPAGAKFVDVICIAGGRGGSSGGLANNSTSANATGGSSGQFGSISAAFLIPAEILSTDVTVTVGAGGAGGASRTTSGSGNSGSAGGASSFGSYVSASQSIAVSEGASTGGSVTSNIGANGTAGNFIANASPTLIFSSSSSTAANITNGGPSAAVVGGTAGTAASTTNATATGGNGGEGTALTGLSAGRISSGGGGGGGAGVTNAGSATACIGGDGGNGGFPGGAGGGGGAAAAQRSSLPTGSRSGKGGDGGSGVVIVITRF